LARPFFVIIVDQLPFWKVIGKHSPLATRFYKVMDGIPYEPKAVFSPAVIKIQGLFYKLPLAVAQVGSIVHIIAFHICISKLL